MVISGINYVDGKQLLFVVVDAVAGVAAEHTSKYVRGRGRRMIKVGRSRTCTIHPITLVTISSM